MTSSKKVNETEANPSVKPLSIKAEKAEWGRKVRNIPKHITDPRIKWVYFDGQYEEYLTLKKRMTKLQALKQLGKDDEFKATLVVTKAICHVSVEEEREQYKEVQADLKATGEATKDLGRVNEIINAPAPEVDRSDLPDDLAWVYDHPLLLKAVQHPDQPTLASKEALADAPSLGARSMLSMALAEPKWLLDKVLKHMMDRDKKAAPDKESADDEERELTADDIQLEEIEAMLKGTN